MPYARITSNIPQGSVDTVAVSTAVAHTLTEAWGVPAAFMMVHLDLGAPLVLGFTDEPAAYVHARTIGNVDADHNPKAIEILTKTVSEQLKVPAERVYVVLEDVKVGNWGSNGITVVPPTKK